MSQGDGVDSGEELGGCLCRFGNGRTLRHSSGAEASGVCLLSFLAGLKENGILRKIRIYFTK